jgi:DNA-binding winged helix-turn-helix (wHTH) protein/TolB-like protein
MPSPDGAPRAEILRFGLFELDATTCELRRQGALVRLPLQPARALRLLAGRAGELVTREELRLELWGNDTFVDFEAGLAACVNQIRHALGDRAASPLFVETLPRLGYRFIAPVTRQAPGTAAGASPAAPMTSAPVVARHARLLRARLIAAIAALVAVTFAAAWNLWHGDAPAPEAPPPSIVVLPIPVAADEPGLARVAETLTEGVIGELATLAAPRIRVASRLQSETLRGRDVDLDAIRALRADFFVAVTLRRIGGPVRVHAKLAHASGWILWSTDYDLDPASLAALQTDIAVSIARKAAYEIVPPSPESARRAPAPAAIADFSQARQDLGRGRFAAAIEGFARALGADPSHLSSLEGLAQAHLHLALDDPASAAAHFAAAEQAIDRARAIDADFAGGLAARGALFFARDLAPARAEPLLRRAVELEPGLATARLWHAEVLAALGASDAAVAEAEQGRAVDPMSVDANRVLGHVELLAGRYRPLLAQAERVLALAPDAAGPHLWRAWAYEQVGDGAAAGRARWQFVAALGLAPPSSPQSLSWEATDAALQRWGAARPSFFRALVAAACGRRAEALAALERCRQERPIELLWIARHPSFEALRDDPRFRALIPAGVAAGPADAAQLAS